MKKYIDAEIKDAYREINKTFQSIWEFTYKIVSADEERVRLVSRDPDNLLVQWISSEEIYCEELRLTSNVT